MNKFGLVFLLAIGVSGLASAQSGAVVRAGGSGGWGAGSALNKLWNPRTEITFKGRVTGVQRSQPFRGMDPGVSLLLKNTKGGTALVELGPSWFLDNQKLKFKLGDRLTVTGSKVSVSGKTSVLARKVVKGNRVLYLRGTDGFPMWIAWRGHVAVGSASVASTTPRTQVMNGRVVEIGNVRLQNSPYMSSFVVLENERGERYTVEVGPQWFVDRQDFIVNMGDTLIIDAAAGRGFIGETRVFHANNLRRGNEVLTLRYQNGRPVWEAWGGN